MGVLDMKKTSNRPKNFLLFFYDFEYPKGGMRDYVGAYGTAKQAHKAAKEIKQEIADEYEESLDQVEASYHILHMTQRRVILPDGEKMALRSWGKKR